MGCCGPSPGDRRAALKSVGISEKDICSKGALQSAFKLFSRADDSGDLRLDVREFGRAFCLEDNPFLHRMFNAFDESGEGTIDFSEFLMGIANFAGAPASDARAKFCFRLLDLDSSGTFSISELLAVYRLEKRCVKIRLQLERQENAWVDRGKNPEQLDLRHWKRLLDGLKSSSKASGQRPVFNYEQFVRLRAAHPKVFYPADLVYTAFSMYAEPAAQVVRDLRAAGNPRFQPRQSSRLLTSKRTPKVIKLVAKRVNESFRQTRRNLREVSRSRRRLKSRRAMPPLEEGGERGRRDRSRGLKSSFRETLKKLRVALDQSEDRVGGGGGGGGGGGRRRRGLREVSRKMNETFNKLFHRSQVGVQYMEAPRAPPGHQPKPNGFGAPPNGFGGPPPEGYARQGSSGGYGGAPPEGYGRQGSSGYGGAPPCGYARQGSSMGRPSNGVGGVVGVGLGAGEDLYPPSGKQHLPPIQGGGS